MPEGRVVIDGEPRGAAFLIKPDLAITSRHVIKDALDADGNPQRGFEFTLELRDGSRPIAMVEACDPVLDVASVRIVEPLPEWFQISIPTQGATWEVTTRFLATDPVLTGTITNTARPIRNNSGHETTLIQLRVDQNLGSYKGYSGSPVCLQKAVPGSARTPVAVGVLVEQGLWRTPKQPGQSQDTVANVLWAAPFPAIFNALGLTPEVRPYGDWTLISPVQAFFWETHVDPLDPLTIYACLSNGQGMYRSNDGGRYWEPINTGWGTRKVYGIAASFFESILYVATEAGLWMSNDRGATWREHPDPKYRGKRLISIALSPHDPKLKLVGAAHPDGVSGVSLSSDAAVAPDSDSVDDKGLEGLEGSGLKLSRDGGKTWVTFPWADNVNNIWVDPEDSRVFAAASATHGLFFSRDGPEILRRRRVEAFPAGQKPVHVALLPGDPDRLLVGTLHGGLYWSDDDGVSWERGSGIPDVQVSDIKFLVGAPSRIAAATPLGPFESDDGGKRWRRSARGLDYKFSMTLAPMADGSVILGTSGGGAYRRVGGQSTWNPSSRGLPHAIALRLRQAGGWLLAGTVGLLRSPDGGASWRYSGLAGEQVLEITVAPEWVEEDPHSHIEQGGLFVIREDFGPSTLVVPKDDSPIEILIGTAKGELFRSRDSGASWEPLTTPGSWGYNHIRSITLSSGAPRRIGVLVEHRGFFISDDGGQNWSADASDVLGTRIALVVASQHDDRRLFALTVDRGVFRSDDGGTTWSECAGCPSDETFVAIAELDNDAEVVFAASLLPSVYRSADGGRTFGRIGSVDLPTNKDPSKVPWTSLVVLPHADAPSTLVLGSSMGACLSRDEGRTWKSLPAGILKNNYHVNDLLLTDGGTRILMATNKGIFSQELLDLSTGSSWLTVWKDS